MWTNIYTKDELGYFRLAKGVVNHSTAALRKVLKQEWNYLYPLTPWRNDGTSGSQMLAEEQPSSRLYDPKFAKDYQAIKDHLRHGDVEQWDVSTLVFALLYSYALSGIRDNGRHWRRVKNAIHEIKEVRNTVLSHACKASIDRSTFQRIFGILERAVEDLLTTSDPLVGKLKALRTETEFFTDDLGKYKKLHQEDNNSLHLLDKHLERLECKMNISIPKGDARNKHARSSAATSDNHEIISEMYRRVDRLERELPSCVDSVPEPFKPTIFHSARYILLMNKSGVMSANYRWEEVDNFLQGFNDSVDMQIYAGIQSTVALSHRSRKDECFEALKRLVPKALLAKQHGVVLHARIKIVKAYNLHDRGNDDEAMKEVDEAEMMLSLGECHEDLAEINSAKANIILSSGKNSADDRERILFHLDKCIHLCEKAPVDKSITVAQAKLRKALFHLGYYQHGILEEAPKSSDVKIAETILSRVAKQSDLAERSKVYLMYGQSLLAYRKGETNMATKLENKLRRKCEDHKIRYEIEQLDMLRTLVRGSPNYQGTKIKACRGFL